MTNNLSNPVLVLNKGWQPIAVASVKKSIAQVCRESAFFLHSNDYIMHDFDSWLDLEAEPKYIQMAQNRRMKMPEIIILSSYNKFPKRDVMLNRRNVLIRDNYRCQYTGVALSYKNATIDHVHPQSKGGKTTWDNVVICSKEANLKKGNKILTECGFELKTKPVKPQWSPIYSRFVKISNQSSRTPKSWKAFIPQQWKNQGGADIEIIEDDM